MFLKKNQTFSFLSGRPRTKLATAYSTLYFITEYCILLQFPQFQSPIPPRSYEIMFQSLLVAIDSKIRYPLAPTRSCFNP